MIKTVIKQCSKDRTNNNIIILYLNTKFQSIKIWFETSVNLFLCFKFEQTKELVKFPNKFFALHTKGILNKMQKKPKSFYTNNRTTNSGWSLLKGSLQESCQPPIVQCLTSKELAKLLTNKGWCKINLDKLCYNFAQPTIIMCSTLPWQRLILYSH